MAKRYPQAKIDEALLAHFTHGDYGKAAQTAKVPKTTVYEWVTERYADRYRELAERHGARIEQHLADRMLTVAGQATEATADMIERTTQAQDPKDASALSTAARNLSTIAGISTDKRLILTGRPTQIHQHATAEDDLRALARMFNITLEGTAVDVTHEDPNQALDEQRRTANAVKQLAA